VVKEGTWAVLAGDGTAWFASFDTVNSDENADALRALNAALFRARSVVNLWPDDGTNGGQRGFWLDPDFQRRGLMTEAADRVTDYAFRDLGWATLCLTNAQGNHASRRIKEKQGARLIDLRIAHCVSGQVTQMVWQLLREDWLARQPLQSKNVSRAEAELSK
jgi:RimJ/RimL family protein N-acetyltransferase